MRAKVARWGHSLALRLPRHLVQEAGLSEGAVVELQARSGGFDVAAVTDPVPPLEDLLAQITDANLHQAVDSGPAVGAEAW
jgi:antitoxin MazE